MPSPRDDVPRQPGPDESGERPRTVVAPTSEPVRAGETAWVYGAGTVVVEGGEVHVGTGGRCLVVGRATVRLVEDGMRRLPLQRRTPYAVLRDGAVVAETGRAWLGPGTTYLASGDAHLCVSGAGGEVRDGRLVSVEERAALDLDGVWQALLLDSAVEGRPGPTQWLDPEPQDDPVEWLAPLLGALAELGGELATVRRPRGTRLTVTVHEPRAVLAHVANRLGIPPSLRLLRADPDECALFSDHGVTVVVRAPR